MQACLQYEIRVRSCRQIRFGWIISWSVWTFLVSVRSPTFPVAFPLNAREPWTHPCLQPLAVCLSVSGDYVSPIQRSVRLRGENKHYAERCCCQRFMGLKGHMQQHSIRFRLKTIMLSTQLMLPLSGTKVAFMNSVFAWNLQPMCEHIWGENWELIHSLYSLHSNYSSQNMQINDLPMMCSFHATWAFDPRGTFARFVPPGSSSSNNNSSLHCKGGGWCLHALRLPPLPWPHRWVCSVGTPEIHKAKSFFHYPDVITIYKLINNDNHQHCLWLIMVVKGEGCTSLLQWHLIFVNGLEIRKCDFIHLSFSHKVIFL